MRVKACHEAGQEPWGDRQGHAGGRTGAGALELSLEDLILPDKVGPMIESQYSIPRSKSLPMMCDSGS